MSTKQFLRTAAVAIVAALVAMPAQADDYFRHGGIRYKIESFVDQELRVTFPEEADYSTTNLVIPATIRTKQGQVWTVTTIGEDAFKRFSWETGYKNLRSITIPKTIKFIHQNAFRESEVTTLTVNCAKHFPTEHLKKTLVTLNLGQLATFKEVEEDYFTCFEEIRTITVVPQNTAFAVEDGVLYNKTKTVLLCFPYGKSVLRMPATVQRFAMTKDYKGDLFTKAINHNYKTNTDITEIYFSPAIKEIWQSTFSNCKNLKKVTLPTGLTTIGSHAFYMTALESIILPNTLTTIGYSAFGRTQLSSVVIPNSVTKMEYGVFELCPNLKQVTLPNTITEIEFNMFHI